MGLIFFCVFFGSVKENIILTLVKMVRKILFKTIAKRVLQQGREMRLKKEKWGFIAKEGWESVDGRLLRRNIKGR